MSRCGSPTALREAQMNADFGGIPGGTGAIQRIIGCNISMTYLDKVFSSVSATILEMRNPGSDAFRAPFWSALRPYMQAPGYHMGYFRPIRQRRWICCSAARLLGAETRQASTGTECRV